MKARQILVVRHEIETIPIKELMDCIGVAYDTISAIAPTLEAVIREMQEGDEYNAIIIDVGDIRLSNTISAELWNWYVPRLCVLVVGTEDPPYGMAVPTLHAAIEALR